MFTESWEQETLALLQEAEVEKLDAERRLEKARDDLMDKTRAVESVRLVIEQYRHKYSVPNEHIESPVLELQYSSLGPIGQIDSWASKHEGEVIITELLTELVRAKAYKSRDKASGSIRSTIHRSKQYEKINSGHYRRKS